MGIYQTYISLAQCHKWKTHSKDRTHYIIMICEPNLVTAAQRRVKIMTDEREITLLVLNSVNALYVNEFFLSLL